MKFQQAAEAAPGRSTRGRRASSTLSEINVVPLVDVMLVLLIIFMVAAPMLQRGVEVNLPVASRSRRSRATACSSTSRLPTVRIAASSSRRNRSGSIFSPSASGRS